MNNDQFAIVVGMTFEQALEKLEQIKARNRASEQALLDKVAEAKKKQSLRRKLEWFINLDRRKKELIRLRNGDQL